MKDRKLFRIVMVALCFAGAGLNAYKILEGDYSGLDIFLLVVFLVFAGVYVYQLRKSQV
jgi:hypothetical protein